MRKRILGTIPQSTVQTSTDWLALDQIASIEVTSEQASYSIDNALLHGAPSGWRAALPGEQTIRLIFDTPQNLKRIWLLFMESEVERCQEFVVRWSSDGKTFQEIVRQQWNFSPRGSVQEVEDYVVELPGALQLELKIVPDRNGAAAHASLAQLRLA